MATQDVPDGNTDFSGGQDASKNPDQVPPNAYYSGINITTSKGVLGPRFGNHYRKVTIPSGGVKTPTGLITKYNYIYNSGKFQALIPYSIGTQFYEIAVISGVIFLINQDTYSVEVLTLPGTDSLNENAARLNWSNAGRFLEIYDFPSYPVIIEGNTARRADPAKYETPISNLGTYNQNRLAIANAGNEFTLGDPSGSLATPDAPITFEEVLLPGAFFGQFFQLSTNYNNDPITAMGFLQTIDTSTGIGPLLVSTQSAVYSYQTQNPRTSWQAGQFGSIFIPSTGFAGQRAFTNVSSDVFFLSSDGQVRSASMSRQEQGKWAKVPISREVTNFLKYYDKSLIPYGFVTYFQNKIFISCNPYRITATNTLGEEVYDYTNGGMVVLELDNLSGLGQDSPPTWAGLWTGIRPMDMCVNNNRAFIMEKSGGINRLYEVMPDKNYDVHDIGEQEITSRIYTREYDFQAAFVDKQLSGFELELNKVQGKFDYTLEYKVAHSSDFVFWRNFKHEAPYNTCKIPKNCEANGFAKHNFLYINLGTPPSSSAKCSPVTNEMYETFRKVQLKMTMKGRDWEIKGFVIRATVDSTQNTTDSVCRGYKSAVLCEQCNDDWNLSVKESICLP